MYIRIITVNNVCEDNYHHWIANPSVLAQPHQSLYTTIYGEGIYVHWTHVFYCTNCMQKTKLYDMSWTCLHQLICVHVTYTMHKTETEIVSCTHCTGIYNVIQRVDISVHDYTEGKE